MYLWAQWYILFNKKTYTGKNLKLLFMLLFKSVIINRLGYTHLNLCFSFSSHNQSFYSHRGDSLTSHYSITILVASNKAECITNYCFIEFCFVLLLLHKPSTICTICLWVSHVEHHARLLNYFHLWPSSNNKRGYTLWPQL